MLNIYCNKETKIDEISNILETGVVLISRPEIDEVPDINVFKQFVIALTTNEKIKKLGIWFIPLNIEYIEILGACLTKSKITSLELHSNNICEAEISIFAKYLSHTSIIHLKLYNNEIGPNGAKIIASKLHMTHITSLDMEFTNIGDEGAIGLAKILHTTKIAKLDLPHNHIGVAGAVILAKAISQSNILLEVKGIEFCQEDACLVKSTLDNNVIADKESRAKQEFEGSAMLLSEDRASLFDEPDYAPTGCCNMCTIL